MKKPRGKTPSLFSQSSGKPSLYVCKKKSTCKRCESEILMGGSCFHIPKTSNGFTSPKIFCLDCFESILNQTKKEYDELEAILISLKSGL